MLKLTNEDDFNNLFISENLKRLRLAHNLSTTQVATVIKKSRQGYLNYELGSREIGIHDLVTLSGFYGASIDEMVGNPFTMRNEKRLAFRTYEYLEGELKQVMPISITTANDDVICVKHDENHIDFFWRTSTHQKNRIMLFEYYNKAYVSKVYYNKDNSGFFFIEGEPFNFTKAHAENIVYKGVYASSITKEFHIQNFF